jgi:large subunit ribosomal protein L37Ae
MVTKIVGTTGRFGVRYGKRLRTRVLQIEDRQRKKQLCPYCDRYQIKRLAAGIYQCKKCEMKFTGDAYLMKA